MKSKVKFVSAVAVHLWTIFWICLWFSLNPRSYCLTFGKKKKKAYPASFAELPGSCRQRGSSVPFFLPCGLAKMGAQSGLQSSQVPSFQPTPLEHCVACTLHSAQLCQAGADKPPHLAPLDQSMRCTEWEQILPHSFVGQTAANKGT